MSFPPFESVCLCAVVDVDVACN